VVGEGADDASLLEAFARNETAAEAQPWRPYREILAESLSAACEANGIRPSPVQRAQFGRSVADWPAFPDSSAALQELARRFELGVITNCDDDLFDYSNELLGKPFRWIVTAQQVRAYKPNIRNFEVCLARIDRPREATVHVAQSLYHDHVPAKALGLRTIWLNRRHDRRGTGATPTAIASPDLVVNDMATLARMIA
jgi:2-haloacid dehalogenase